MIKSFIRSIHNTHIYKIVLASAAMIKSNKKVSRKKHFSFHRSIFFFVKKTFAMDETRSNSYIIKLMMHVVLENICSRLLERILECSPTQFYDL